MDFNEQQTKTIYEFIMRYNSDEEFKIKMQSLYDEKVSDLSLLHIYALEEVLRYKNKDIFNKFLKSKGDYSISQAIELYDNFIYLLNNDKSFRLYKEEQLEKYKEALSDLEKFAFTLINASYDKKHKNESEKLEYDPFNPILYSYDKQIRETLENLLLGEVIHQILELQEMKPIKARQRENGRIANIDKPFIIKELQRLFSTQEYMNQFKQAVDNRYVKVKMDLLLGKKEKAFEQYLKFNTNISSAEILGIKREEHVDVINEYLKNIINNNGRRTP